MTEAPEDLAAFCAREYPRLVGALHLYCGDHHVAEEMAQEALLRACRDWPRLRTLGSPGGYTRRVAVNLATSHYRRRQAERRATQRLAARGRPAAHGPGHDPADAVAVRAALQHLPPKQRMAVVLRFYLDLPVSEVAADPVAADPTAAEPDSPFAPPTIAPSLPPDGAVPAGEPLVGIPLDPFLEESGIEAPGWFEHLPAVDPPPDPGVEAEPGGTLVLFGGVRGIPADPLRAALEAAGVRVETVELHVSAGGVGDAVALTDNPGEAEDWRRFGASNHLEGNLRVFPDRVGGTAWLAVGVATPPGEPFQVHTALSPLAPGEVLGGVHCALGEPDRPMTSAGLEQVARQLGLTVSWRALTLADTCRLPRRGSPARPRAPARCRAGSTTAGRRSASGRTGWSRASGRTATVCSASR